VAPEGSSLSGNKMGLHKGFSFHDFVSLNVYMYSTLNSLEYHHLHKCVIPDPTFKV